MNLARTTAILLLLAPAAASAVTPGTPVLLDAFADSPEGSGFGAVFLADRSGDPSANATPFAGHADLYLAASVAFEPGGDFLLADVDADPSGLGTVPNGGDGPGALFRADGDTGLVVLLSDGSDYTPGLPGGRSTIFVEPSGVAVRADGRILLADMDADPSRFGDDPNGLPGHGALFLVDPATGQVDLLTDGSDAPGGLPPGEESVMVDPVAVALGGDGSVWLLDRMADPLGLGRHGAVFLVGVGGAVTVAASPPGFQQPRDLAVLPDGRIAVTDAVAGTVFAVDPASPDPGAPAEVLTSDPSLVGPAGIAAAPNGWLFVADEFADPLGLSRYGALFEIDPRSGIALAVSSDAAFRDPVDAAVPPPTGPAPVVTGVDPPSLLQGESAVVTVTGSGFAPEALPDPGPGIGLGEITVLDPGTLTARFDVPIDTPPGARDVMVHNPDLQAGTLASGFSVLERPGPWIDTLDPTEGARGSSLTVLITGGNFDPDATADFGAGVSVTALRRLDAARVEADLEIDPAAVLGPRDVTVTNPDTLFDMLPAGFEVTLPPPPRIDSVEPDTVVPGARQTLLLLGDGMRPGAIVEAGPGLRVLATGIRSIHEIELLIWAEGDAVAGPRTVTVTDPETGAGSLPGGVAVAAMPLPRLVHLRVGDGDPARGNGSGRADPGETIDLVPTLANRGNTAASTPAVTLWVQPSVQGVRVAQEFVELPDLPAGGASTRQAPPHLELEIGEEVACGAAVPLRLDVRPRDGEGMSLWTELLVGGPQDWLERIRLGGSPGDHLGASVTGAGDADGDGVADWAVGAPGRDAGAWVGAGRVLLFSGARGDLLLELEGGADGEALGSSLAGPGDLDGDTLADLVVGVPGAGGGAGRVEARSPADRSLIWFVSGTAAEGLGSSLAATGDADGDGVGEVAAGAPYASPGGTAGAGRVLLISGATGEMLDLREGTETGEALGSSLAAAGDLDGDGLADWLIGAPGADFGAGAVVARGLEVEGGRDRWIAPGRPGEGLGIAVAPAGDVDGDGLLDVAAGAAPPSGIGRLTLLDRYGGEFLSLDGSPGEAFAAALAPAGDADGDGRDDLWVGAPEALAGGGEVRLLSLTDRRLIGLLQGEPGDGMGGELAAPGDLGQDGWPDLLVGSPGADPAGRTDGGRLHRVDALSGCRAFDPCDNDPNEPNDVPAAATPLALQQRMENLVLCPGDLDWFRIDLPAGGGLGGRVFFDPQSAPLDLFLFREEGTLLDASLGGRGMEEVGAEGLDPGSYLLLVQGGVAGPIAYDLEALDPESCLPVHEVGGLRARRDGEEIVLQWEPTPDVCHDAYLVYASQVAAPASGGSFPDDPPFQEQADRDANQADTSARIAPPGSIAFLLVTTSNASGQEGPAGHYASP